MTRGYPGDPPLSQAQIDAVLIADGVTPASQCKAKRRGAPKKSSNRNEDKLQVAVVKHLTALIGGPRDEIAAERLGVLWYAVEQARAGRLKVNPRTGKKYDPQAFLNKAKGVRRGVTDLHFYWRVGTGGNAYGRAGVIELKWGNNDLSVDQRIMHRCLGFVCIPTETCWSVDEVERALRGWGVPMMGRTIA